MKTHVANRLKLISAGLLLVIFTLVKPCLADTGPEQAARAVIQRIAPSVVDRIHLETIPADHDRDVYEYQSTGGNLTIRGNTGVAICRGFYDYLQANKLGMVSWGGARLGLPVIWPDASLRRVITPYEHRFYFNVVTYGYTMPYWTWDRWQQEIDWMALHGINLPLALVGNEAIGQRVFQKAGLTQNEIDSFYTGPAHLPWQRMGNITGVDGPLPQSWHTDQIALEHKILDRMHELGIEPIVPAFAGFVPKEMKRVHPEVQLHELNWGGFPSSKHAWLLAPDSPLFGELGTSFIHEWEKEFGKCRYYLADSFNEMQLPKTDQPVTDLLAGYGDATYRSIHGGDPDAVWVVQGWMFGYQREIWNAKTVAALLSKVPDDKMLILDEACDFNGVYWKNGMNWSLFNGFDNKPWIYGIIPNMGGSTTWNGALDFYATDSNKAFNSPNKGRMSGLGFSPEGIENNDVIYEMMADLAWRNDPIKLDDWLPTYCANRYGSCPNAMTKAWNLFRQSCYGTFSDHARFGWQSGRFGHGSVTDDPRFFEGVKLFLSCADQLKNSPLYKADAIELAATVLGVKADDWFALARKTRDTGKDDALADQAFDRGIQLLTDCDQLLESHPLDRLQRWTDFARAHGTTDAEKDYYEQNARRIVTVWGPPVNDYSNRMWSGLIRDYYRERMKLIFNALKTGKRFEKAKWEASFVASHGESQIEPFNDPLNSATKLVDAACAIKIPDAPAPDSIGNWTPDQMSTEWKTIDWPITADELKRMGGVQFMYTAGHHRLDINWVAVIADGKEIIRDTHYGYAGLPDSNNTYKLEIPPGTQANNGCVIRASIRSDGGTDSKGRILLVAGSSSRR
jgi:alpha-N-acetylglucosaminidase